MTAEKPLYYRLLDNHNKGTIMKSEGRKSYEYVKGKGWVRSARLVHYFFPESDIYGQYEEISEQQANELISKK